MTEMGRRGHEVEIVVLGDGWDRLPSLRELTRFDVVYFWRLYEPPVRGLVDPLQRAGTAVIWDNDDNMPAVPRGTPSYRVYGGVAGQREWREMVSMIRAVAAVTTPSGDLAERFKAAGQQHVTVIENHVEEVAGGGLLSRRSNSRRVVVGWVAGGEHVVDAAKLRLAESMGRMLELRPEVELVTVGVKLGLTHERYRWIKHVPFEQLPRTVAEFDVGIAPLIDIPFNRSRSNVKLKEYGAQGVPWLASPIGPYAGLGEAEGGRLVEAEDWLDALSAIVDDARGRRRLARRARKWASGQTIGRHGDAWEAVLTGAIDRVRGSGDAAAGTLRMAAQR